MNETTQLLNPNLDTGALLSKIIFFGSIINAYMIMGIHKIFVILNIPLNEIHAGYIVLIVYGILLYLVICVLEIAKPIIKWSIVSLICLLVLGFFAPVR